MIHHYHWKPPILSIGVQTFSPTFRFARTLHTTLVQTGHIHNSHMSRKENPSHEKKAETSLEQSQQSSCTAGTLDFEFLLSLHHWNHAHMTRGL
jgi:hypothetical protein